MNEELENRPEENESEEQVKSFYGEGEDRKSTRLNYSH